MRRFLSPTRESWNGYCDWNMSYCLHRVDRWCFGFLADVFPTFRDCTGNFTVVKDLIELEIVDQLWNVQGVDY